MDTEKKRRGRPRRFDMELALDKGRALFHARGYDAVGISAITAEIGIEPPSFYAAFGSKAEYFRQVVERYAASASLYEAMFADEKAPAGVISELFAAAAVAYAADPTALGCLIVEHLRLDNDPQITTFVQTIAAPRSARLRTFVARTHPDAAEAVDDYVASVLFGLSACARKGWGVERLSRVAQAAALGLAVLLPDASSPFPT